MKKITNEIGIFLDKISQKQPFPRSRFSTSSKKWLSRLFHLIFQSEKEFVETNNYEITKEFVKGKQYDFIPESIRNHIENMSKKVVKYTFFVGKREIQVNLVFEKNMNLGDIMKKIFMWFYIANFYASKNSCSQKIHLYLFMTSLKKTLPKENGVIEMEDANTAFTNSCLPCSEIYIFREEEWFKVLIHETFHCMGFDFSQMENHEYDEKILELFPIKSDVRLYETYCEMWAETIQIMFLCYFSGDRMENMIENMEKMMYYEKMFSLYQCAKVLHFFGLSYSNLYGSSPKDVELRKKYCEKTQVFSYYILKSILMFYSNDFIEWCRGSIVFVKNQSTLDSYCSFFREHYQRSDFLEYLHIMESLKPYSVNDVTNTLRMTMFE